MSDLSANFMQTPASCCGSVKTVCKYLTIEKLSGCECTATVVVYSHASCRGICYMTAVNLPHACRRVAETLQVHGIVISLRS